VPTAPHPAAAPTGSTEAVRDHLQALGRRAEVRDDGWGGCEVRFAAPDPLPLVSVIVPTRDRLGLLRRCVDGVLRQTDYPALELIVVDNGSREPATRRYLDSLAADSRVVVLRDDAPFNYSALNNLAAGRARGELLLLLNNDTEVLDASWLRAMVALAVRPEIGAVGARLWYDDFTLQHGGLVVGLHGVAGDPHPRLPRGAPGVQGRAVRLQSCSAVTAACLLVRRSVYLGAGGLDAERLAVAYNDVDFCLKLRLRGLRNVWVPQAELLHHESRSRGRDDQGERARRLAAERETMRQRWGEALHADPYYNPNLALEGRVASMAWPPRVTLRETLLCDRGEATAGSSVASGRPATSGLTRGRVQL
jgi:GT2 family glycosyltransferase